MDTEEYAALTATATAWWTKAFTAQAKTALARAEWEVAEEHSEALRHEAERADRHIRAFWDKEYRLSMWRKSWQIVTGESK